MANLMLRIVGIALFCSAAACAADTSEEETSQPRKQVYGDENADDETAWPAPQQVPEVKDNALTPRGQSRVVLNNPIY
jgi:hypothetical protein